MFTLDNSRVIGQLEQQMQDLIGLSHALCPLKLSV